MVTYGSVCSGIEATSVAWESLGLKPLWFSEIENFPCAVLAYHWPDVPNHGDMTRLTEKILNRKIPAPDILVGGTPCQAFSIAGQRGSLSDERGNLTLELVRILNAIDFVRKQDGKRPAILVWENVPGVLSTKDNALGCFLGAVAGEDIPIQPAGKKWTGAGFVSGQKRNIAWRTLDAQFFGVPQRRRRIFLVASARKDISVAKILFEPESVCGNIKKSTSQKPDVARTITAGVGSRVDASRDTYVLKREGMTISGKKIYPTLLASMAVKQWLGNQEAFSGDYFIINSNIINKTEKSGGNGKGVNCNTAMYTITATDHHAIKYLREDPRRLTPIECERLQGFPDNYTQIPYRKKTKDKCPDTCRYKAIGNSMAVPVMRWLGNRVLLNL